MTCKDCIHYDMCGGFIPSDLDKDVFDYCRKGRTDEIPDIEERCNSFKDKSRYIELPCKVGDTVYKIGTYPWPSECGECEHFMPGGFGDPCECLKTDDGKKAPECRTIVEYKAELRDILNAIGWEDFGKTVFLTKEEAEAKLKERTDNG